MNLTEDISCGKEESVHVRGEVAQPQHIGEDAAQPIGEEAAQSQPGVSMVP